MNEPSVYGFEKPVAVTLRNIARSQSSGQPLLSRTLEDRRVAICLTPSGGIPARSGTTPGTGTITLCEIDGTAITTTSVQETGYNIDCSSIPASEYTGCYREYGSGQWIVEQLPVTDMRLDGNNLQLKRGCSWTTWHTGTDCPEV